MEIILDKTLIKDVPNTQYKISITRDKNVRFSKYLSQELNYKFAITKNGNDLFLFSIGSGLEIANNHYCKVKIAGEILLENSNLRDYGAWDLLAEKTEIDNETYWKLSIPESTLELYREIDARNEEWAKDEETEEAE